MTASVSSNVQAGTRHGDGTANGDPSEAHAMLIDALINAAPQLIRQRQLLPAFDWSTADKLHIQRLVEGLGNASLAMPVWLARDILIAGHALPETLTSTLPAELRVLNRLNGVEPGASLDDVLGEVLDLTRILPPSGDGATAIVRRMSELGAREEACVVALAAWPETPRALHQARDALASHVASLPVVEVSVAGFSTTSTFAKALLPAFAKRGIAIKASEAPYGAAVAALHAPAAGTKAALILLDPQSLLDTSWRMGVEAAAADVAARLEGIEQAIATFSANAGLPLLINTLPAGAEPSMGYMDGYHRAGLATLTRQTNEALGALAARHANVSLIDTDVALAGIAHDGRHDPRMWFYGRIAYAEAAVNKIADAYAAAWTINQAKPVKVIALDFDNTLWGGVFGDDGVARLQCGDDPPGNAFKALQSECLRLKAQGKLLVALSKNNPDALSAFDQHPGMALRKDDFAATAVNWEPKPENIRQIAQDLNLGLDSFLFLDDSPHEREAMRRLCPQVLVPEMPADPAARPRWLRGLTQTWPARLTAEDMERPAMYLAERKARELKATTASYDDYLRGLEQRLMIEPLSARTLPRIAQLHERTNQFNPMTQRYTEAELSGFMTRANDRLVLLGTAEDRFGKHGIVIAAVARLEGTRAYIDSLVMSCRVIARQVETAFLGALIERLCQRGVSEVVAGYRQTAKNGLVRDLYAKHGFLPLATEDKEVENWIWKVNEQQVPASAFVTIEWST